MESAELNLQQLGRLHRELVSFHRCIGLGGGAGNNNGKDGPLLRQRIGVTRSKWLSTESQIVDQLRRSSSDVATASDAQRRAMAILKQQLVTEKKAFDDINGQLRRKEAEFPIPDAPTSTAGGLVASSATSIGRVAAPPATGATQSQQQRTPSVLLASHITEERLATERLAAAVEIDRQLRETHQLFSEFRDVAREQQVGLDVIEQQVDAAGKSVKKGTVEIQKARHLQRSLW